MMRLFINVSEVFVTHFTKAFVKNFIKQIMGFSTSRLVVIAFE